MNNKYTQKIKKYLKENIIKKIYTKITISNKRWHTKFPVLYLSISEICLELTSFKIKGNILSPVL